MVWGIVSIDHIEQYLFISISILCRGGPFCAIMSFKPTQDKCEIYKKAHV